jgi:3-oxoacyl-[acyl-carrier protein] reductase
MDVRGKAALITGGGTGVGRATALALAARGCAVAVNYSRSRDEAEATAAEARGQGVAAVAIQADVAEDADCRRLVETAVGELGRLDVLVQSAGVTSFIPHPNLEDVKDEDWDRILGVNLKGVFQCARAAREPMEAAGAGVIVNVSSVAGIAGVGSSIPYCASKAAVNNLTITLARTLAPRIRVNAVAPGFITGRWLAGGLGDAYEAVKSAMEAKAPLGRVCEPEDVADVILSLVTGSELVTGTVVPVEGGMLIAG